MSLVDERYLFRIVNSLIQDQKKAVLAVMVLFIYIYTLIVYYLTFDLVRELTYLLPRLLIYLILISMTLFLVSSYLGSSEPNKRKADLEEQTGKNADLGEDPLEDLEGDSLDMELKSALEMMIWIVAFIFGMVYIGFFTSIALFTLSFTFLKIDEVGIKRLKTVGVWTVGLIIFAYVLYVEIIELSVIWRLGPLI